MIQVFLPQTVHFLSSLQHDKLIIYKQQTVFTLGLCVELGLKVMSAKYRSRVPSFRTLY